MFHLTCQSPTGRPNLIGVLLQLDGSLHLRCGLTKFWVFLSFLSSFCLVLYFFLCLFSRVERWVYLCRLQAELLFPKLAAAHLQPLLSISHCISGVTMTANLCQIVPSTMVMNWLTKTSLYAHPFQCVISPFLLSSYLQEVCCLFHGVPACVPKRNLKFTAGHLPALPQWKQRLTCCLPACPLSTKHT